MVMTGSRLQLWEGRLSLEQSGRGSDGQAIAWVLRQSVCLVSRGCCDKYHRLVC